MVSKCSFIKEMLKDEKGAQSEYDKAIKIFPDYSLFLEDAKEDESKHHHLFKDLKERYNCK